MSNYNVSSTCVQLDSLSVIKAINFISTNYSSYQLLSHSQLAFYMLTNQSACHSFSFTWYLILQLLTCYSNSNIISYFCSHSLKLSHTFLIEPGTEGSVERWINLQGGATLLLRASHGGDAPPTSRRRSLFRSWSLHRLGKI